MLVEGSSGFQQLGDHSLMAATNSLYPYWVLTRLIFTDFYRFFGLSWANILTRLLFHMATCFFSDDVLWRNHLIDRVELFEENSILLLPECLESSGWQFLKVKVSQES